MLLSHYHCFRMNLQKNRYGWLAETLAAFTFDNDEECLGKSLDNESAYMGKKLSTNKAVPGRLCRDPKFAEFYKETLKADKKTLKII